MYDVLVYDEVVGQFVPARKEDGKRAEFESWDAANDYAFGKTLARDGHAYKVEYRTMRRKRGK